MSDLDEAKLVELRELLTRLPDMTDQEKVEELDRQRAALCDVIVEARRQEQDAVAAELATAAAQLRDLLTQPGGIDPTHAVFILGMLADLLDAEAAICRKFPVLVELIYGARLHVTGLPVLFEAGWEEGVDQDRPPLIRAQPLAHALLIADVITGLEDAAEDEASDG